MKGINTCLTVLMPAYNAAGFIGDAIESILTQSYPYFEFLIIDDGSTDQTTKIVNSYQDSRIRLIYHERNKGVKFTLNEGLKLSSHELIARMDADDISHPWRLEKQIAYMLAHPNCALVDSWVKEIDKDRNYIQTVRSNNKYTYFRLISECPIYHSSVMYRKSCVESVGGYTLDYAEDYELWWNLSRIYFIHTIEEPLLWYRVHEGNTSLVTRKKNYDHCSEWIWDRNLKYYLGEEVSVRDSYKRCYRYDFDAILEEGDLESIYQCIDLLKEITIAILSVENPNRNADDIRSVSHFKKDYIIKELAIRLPYYKMIRLLVHYHYYILALKQLLKRAGRKLFG